jgi:intracellular septation protein
MWVNFKVFGLLPLTLVFALSQAPLMARHAIEDGPDQQKTP